MAYFDYLHCAICKCKVVYDADVDYDQLHDKDAQVVTLCNGCHETYKIVIVPEESNG